MATGVLARGAVSGEDNLYVSHDNGTGWTTSLVATLSKTDRPELAEQESEERSSGGVIVQRFLDAARVSPNGRYFAFMSSRSLTGYDNLDAVSGQPDEEVYLYDTTSDRLVCASCNPTGARPVGLFDAEGSPIAKPLVDREGLWGGDWIAANIPGIHTGDGTHDTNEDPLNQPRYLSNSGRLFFNSSDALVPRDTNGLMDVYQYEPPGTGDCTNMSATFSERSGGCVDLISGGTSSLESAFMDASENGDDVFFSTAQKLVSEDYDTTDDIYDAHVCTTAVPCKTEPVTPPPCTSGDSCKAAPSPQPELFGAAPSATFSGIGNVVEEAKKPLVISKSLTRAQKLARALAACQKRQSKSKRALCRRQVRKRYAAKLSGKVKASKKGIR